MKPVVPDVKPVVHDPGGMLREWSSGHPRCSCLDGTASATCSTRVLEAARDGQGGVLAVYGEPGVGKAALLDYAIEAGAGFRVARTVGVEGEACLIPLTWYAIWRSSLSA